MPIKRDVSIIGQVALTRCVLCVAVRRGDRWRAYIDAVPGKCHDDEALAVIAQGAHLRRAIALAIFPDLPADEYTM